MSWLVGGSKQKSQNSSSSQSSSSNQGFEWAKQLYTPVVQGATNTYSRLQSLLGLGGDKAAAKQGFNDYLDSTDYNFTLDSGSRAITGNAAAKGALGSGATLKALQGYGQATGQKYFGDYLTRLLGLYEGGLGASSQVLGAGNVSSSSSTSQGTGSGSSTGGLAALIGAVAGAAPRG